ncbi:HugZ family protein [Comamonas sp. GB3 AK4-5]|uniref:HugZ family pyridoxamine 5'-phosphate oxidase n=1 Tax=Comamonas sp. GB3 AK4-5 TaxID=3231487 RepID=UPI00351F71E7
MAHEPRLSHSLRQLLHHRRTAALGSLASTAAGPEPFVSLVPYAIDAHSGLLVLHLSGLAAHTRQLQAQPLASLMVAAAEPEDGAVHALERVSLQVRAHTPERDSPEWLAARTAYLARFADVAFMMELGDFRLVCLQPLSARHVAGFGAARDVDAEALRQLLQTPPATAP